MINKKVINKIEKKSISLSEDIGYDLVDVEFQKEGPDYFLRIYIDKHGGVNLDDCQRMSELLSEYLDDEDFIKTPYYLEVSSPGLDRPLKKNKDLKRNIDKEIEISLYKSIDNKKNITGILKDFNNNEILIEESNQEIRSIPRQLISVIKLAIKF